MKIPWRPISASETLDAQIQQRAFALPQGGVGLRLDAHEEVCRTLVAMLRDGADGVTLIGSAGVGKSFLLRRLAAALSDWGPVAVMENPGQPATLFVSQLCEKLAAADATLTCDPANGDIVATLMAQVDKRARNRAPLALVVDSAHLLTGRNLALVTQLADYEYDGFRPVRIVLSGRNALSGKLHKSAYQPLSRRAATVVRLSRLQKSQARLLVGFVWNALFSPQHDRGAPPPITWGGWREILTQADGNPAAIHRIMREISLQCGPGRTQRVDGRVARDAIAFRRSSSPRVIKRTILQTMAAALLLATGYALGHWHGAGKLTLELAVADESATQSTAQRDPELQHASSPVEQAASEPEFSSLEASAQPSEPGDVGVATVDTVNAVAVNGPVATSTSENLPELVETADTAPPVIATAKSPGPSDDGVAQSPQSSVEQAAQSVLAEMDQVAAEAPNSMLESKSSLVTDAVQLSKPSPPPQHDVEPVAKAEPSPKAVMKKPPSAQSVAQTLAPWVEPDAATGEYVLQLGTLSQLDSAVQLANTLKQARWAPFIRRWENDAASSYAVRLRFDTREAAASAQEKINQNLSVHGIILHLEQEPEPVAAQATEEPSS
ncbi:ATP-binding protein [Magnetofaba australis]|uniref:Putative Sporulation domain protein n=1 Tax=Magnetofaba australis IT-1 TaxID=1434232 RepID=A0A1Y2K603_9PROT|nr:ATP-binding protein [Magnetofaba australis]OSM04963.1 putative Sporulation domain protein [Magnetofaba australis IT-1]